MLVGEKSAVALDFLGLPDRFPGRMPTRARQGLLGGLPVEEVYVYPRGNVQVTVYGMVFRGEPTGALHLSLEPNNPNTKLTVKSDGRSIEYPAETGLDWVVAAPEGSTLERDEIGRMVLAHDLHGHRTKSSANDVWSFAKLGLNGFRFVREPA